MPKKVVITADSTCDLSPELLERFDIHTVPLNIQLGSESLKDGQGFSPADMYARYRLDGTLPKTSAASIMEFYDLFAPFTREGAQVLHLDISSELSASFNNARLAATELTGVYPVDSRMLSSGLGLLAIEAAECRDRGMGAEDIAAHLEALREKVDTSFVLDTLEYMWKGGRCSGVAAMGANLLKLKPALEMREGKLAVYKKYRGSMSSVYRKYISERLGSHQARTGHVFLTGSGEIAMAELEELEALVRELVPGAELHRGQAGCTIASHCGPRCLGVLFIRA